MQPERPGLRPRRPPFREALHAGARVVLAQGMGYAFAEIVLAIVFDATKNPPSTVGDALVVAGELLLVFVAVIGLFVWRANRTTGT